MDLILQATGGIMGHTGEEGGPPIKSAPPVADINTGVYAAYGIARRALRARAHGRGPARPRRDARRRRSRCSPTTPPTCSPRARASASSAAAIPTWCRTRRSPRSDGYFIVACLTNAFFKRLCAALGREDLLNDPRFATNPARVEHREEVVGVLSEIFRTDTCEHWIALLEQHDIPACRVNRLDEILAHPQIAANGLIQSTRTPCAAAFARSVRRSRCRRRRRHSSRPAPLLGEHTDEVLREFGLADAEIADLRAARVV